MISQNDNYKTGIVIDSIKVRNSTETFALYLPTSFNNEILSSIVFIFDPAARGSTGIQPFIASAEKYNHILVCSNSCRNGPYDQNFEIINRLFDTVFSDFNLDEKQIYVAGFSGGSRLASAIAVLTDQIQGVIACGAGFSPERSHVPLTKESFSYAGLVGERDMNYYEMFEVSDWLDQFQIENEIFTYDDDHRWPPEEQLIKAFGWLELQAYKRNIRTRDHEITNDLFQNYLNLARSYYNSQHYLKSVLEYDRILRNFRSIYTLDSIQNKVIQLKRKKEYNNELSRHQDLEKEEKKIKKTYSDRFNNEINSQKIPVQHKWWIKKLNGINEEVNLNVDPLYINMLKRVRYGIYAMIVETSYRMLITSKIKKALYCHELVAILLPERPMVYFNLAKDHAFLNDKEESLKNLELAISKGFMDKELITTTREFFKFHGTKEFELLLEGL